MQPAQEPTFRLYNSLTRTVEPVHLLEPGHLRIYSCGPTVYSYAHIGNFRTFLTTDLILRTAQTLGWKTSYVSNVTDVGHLTEDDVADAGGEDKMAKALQSKEGESFANVWDLAEFYARAVIDDWHRLNLLDPDVRPRATQHMREQILAIETLSENGHAYETDQGVYFSVASFDGYGKLSGNEAATALEQGMRDLVTDPDKRDPRDFALWKKDEKHLMQWYSPWGWGFPGWHIECSVMAMHYLGETLDIHAGGEDLRFPHHECEIAQSESLTGRPFATTWVHTRFLQVEGEKMSKSKGNFYTVRGLVDPEAEGGHGVDPLALRYALISGHYRKPFNFTFKNLEDSAKAVARYRDALDAVNAALNPDVADPDAGLAAELDGAYDRTLTAMLDDLNTPLALAAAYEGVKRIGRQPLDAPAARAAWLFLDRIANLLGILRLDEATRDAAPATSRNGAFEKKIEALIAERTAARTSKNWARADEIRDELAALGIELMDSAEGTTWRLKS